jgi:hypothetical protein
MNGVGETSPDIKEIRIPRDLYEIDELFELLQRRWIRGS